MSFNVHEQLTRWRETQLISELDQAFALFLLNQVSDTQPLLILLAALVSRQAADGHTCLSIDEIQQQAENFVGVADADDFASLLNQHSLKSLIDNVILSNGEGHTPLVYDLNRLYLRRHWQAETTVASALLARSQPILNANLDQPLLGTLFPDLPFTNWPKVAAVLSSRATISIITGGPGTGKTTTVVKLLALLQSQHQNEPQALRIALAAPTGKAAARLSESINNAISDLPVDDVIKRAIHCKPKTLHRLLGAQGNGRYRHHRRNPLSFNLVIVDEASMIDLEMMANLLDALDHNTRLILLGDKDQLSSVEAGAVMADICEYASQGGYTQPTIDWVQTTSSVDISKFPALVFDTPHQDSLRPSLSSSSNTTLVDPLAQQTVMLRHNWRFKDAPGITKLAKSINEGVEDDAAACWQFDDVDLIALSGADDAQLAQFCQKHYGIFLDRLHDTKPPTFTGNNLEAWAQTTLTHFSEFQLLTPVRHGALGVFALNTMIERALRNRLIDQASAGPSDTELPTWYEGRPVIVTQNRYDLGLMNGDVGITLNIDSARNQLAVAFTQPSGRIAFIPCARLENVETAFAMTVHKSQGSEFSHTALVLPKHGKGLTRELLYTAVTRARHRFTLLCESTTQTYLQALSTPTQRSSGLSLRLRTSDDAHDSL